MKGQKPIFSSMSDKWRTPKSLYDKLDREFHFDFDPCPTNPTVNGLFVSWKESNYVNPPYSEVARWVEKAWSESLKGQLCVMLLPARTSSKWFHKYVLPYAKEIRFLKGRVNFVNSKGISKIPAPFPSMVVIFSGKDAP